MTGREKFQKFKWAIRFITGFYALFPKNVRKKLLVHHRTTKGIKGIVIRYALLKTLCSGIGDNVAVYEDVYLHNPENIRFGSNVSVHPMCYIEGLGGICIGNDVSVAHGASILSTSHSFADYALPIKQQPLLTGKIVIEDNVWIGAKATVLMGRHIGSGSVVGTGAVVTHDVSPNSIVGGVPAKVIRERAEN